MQSQRRLCAGRSHLAIGVEAPHPLGPLVRRILPCSMQIDHVTSMKRIAWCMAMWSSSNARCQQCHLSAHAMLWSFANLRSLADRSRACRTAAPWPAARSKRAAHVRKPLDEPNCAQQAPAPGMTLRPQQDTCAKGHSLHKQHNMLGTWR